MNNRIRSGAWRLAAAGLACLLAARGHAEDVILVTPEEVVSNTLAHSPALRIAERSVSAAAARRQEASSQLLPTLDARGQAIRYDGLQDATLGPGIMIPAVESRYSASAGITQPLYTGGKLRNLAASAREQAEAAAADQRKATADVTLSALSAYWEWSKAFHTLQALEADVRRVESRAADLRNQRQAGLATDNDELSAAVLADQTRLLRSAALRRLETSRARLAQLGGKPLPATAAPCQAPDPDAKELPALDVLTRDAMNSRPERAALAREAEAASRLAKAARGDAGPKLWLAARYETANPNMMDFPPEEKWQDDWYAGVSAEWNLWDWGRDRARIRSADDSAAAARLRLSQAEEAIAFEVEEAVIALRQACEQVAVSRRLVESTGRNLKAATDQQQNGLARNSDVLAAHALSTDAHAGAIAAAADAALAQARLAYALGRLAPGRAEASNP